MSTTPRYARVHTYSVVELTLNANPEPKNHSSHLRDGSTQGHARTATSLSISRRCTDHRRRCRGRIQRRLAHCKSRGCNRTDRIDQRPGRCRCRLHPDHMCSCRCICCQRCRGRGHTRRDRTYKLLWVRLARRNSMSMPTQHPTWLAR